MVKNPTTMESTQQRRQQELAGWRAIGLLMALVTVAPVVSRAKELSTNGLCRFAVALPEMEGPVTIGIFSAQGNPVRLLYREAPVDSIPAGLNGLLISWDGKDDSGAAVPAGTYRARGLVHGPVAASALPVQEGSMLRPISKDCTTPLPAWIMFPCNRVTMLSAKDALLEKRKPMAITAREQGDGVLVEAEGLPLVFIPLGPMSPMETKDTIEQLSVKISATGIELHQGSESGVAKLSVNRRGRSESYSLVGLDQLVPLDAGSLEMPSDTFHLPHETVDRAASPQ